MVYDGIGPGDSYIGIWRMINNYRHRLKITRERIDADVEGQMPASLRNELERNER